MRRRCNQPNNAYYEWYGGRGIKVCERWNSFALFVEDMGEKPTSQHTLDRIDVNGDYLPENCRWATRKEQAQNRRPRASTEYRIVDGKTGTDWVIKYGKWRARYKGRHIGFFATRQEAHQAYLQARLNSR